MKFLGWTAEALPLSLLHFKADVIDLSVASVSKLPTLEAFQEVAVGRYAFSNAFPEIANIRVERGRRGTMKSTPRKRKATKDSNEIGVSKFPFNRPQF